MLEVRLGISNSLSGATTLETDLPAMQEGTERKVSTIRGSRSGNGGYRIYEAGIRRIRESFKRCRQFGSGYLRKARQVICSITKGHEFSVSRREKERLTYTCIHCDRIENGEHYPDRISHLLIKPDVSNRKIVRAKQKGKRRRRPVSNRRRISLS